MPDEKKPLHPETNFLPPLDMVLTFFDKTFRKRDAQKKTVEEQKEISEKNVEKLIEKLSEKEK
ncbi:MAG TPA: hypothetical protein VIS72_17390 [Anaerolineales bacterium]